MSSPDVDPMFSTQAAHLKLEHREWNKRTNWALGACFITGILVALATWFLQKPIDRDAIMLGGVLALGLATFFFGAMLTRGLIRKPAIRCPQCGHDWEGSEVTDDWLTWNCCPGCGLNMSDENALRIDP